MAGNVVSNVKKYYGGQVPVPGQGDSDGKVKVLVEKTATIEIGGVQTEVELLFDSDDLTTPVTPQQLGQWTDENYLIAFKKRDDNGRVRGFVLYALETDSTSTDTLVNRAEFIAFKEDMAHEPGASAYEFTMVEDSSTLARYLRDENGEMVVKFNQATVEVGAQSGTLDELIQSDTTAIDFEVVREDGKSYLRLNTKGLSGIFDDMDADIQYIIGALDELPSDEHGYFNSSLYTTPGDGTTTNLVMDDFRIAEGRDVSGENIEFVPTRQEGGVDFGNVYLEPGTYILVIQYTLQWVGNPRGTFLPKVCSVADQPFDFSYEHENVIRVTRIVTKTTRGKLVTNIAIDSDTPPMGVWVKNLEIAQIASYNHAAVAHDTTLTGTGKLADPLGITPAAFGKVKDIPTSISQFRTGDVIPVDGPNGPAKMSKDDLLTETAQNTLAGNVAPAFDSTKDYYADDVVIYGGVQYRFLVDHPAGAWTGSDVWDFYDEKSVVPKQRFATSDGTYKFVQKDFDEQTNRLLTPTKYPVFGGKGDVITITPAMGLKVTVLTMTMGTPPVYYPAKVITSGNTDSYTFGSGTYYALMVQKTDESSILSSDFGNTSIEVVQKLASDISAQNINNFSDAVKTDDSVIGAKIPATISDRYTVTPMNRKFPLLDLASRDGDVIFGYRDMAQVGTDVVRLAFIDVHKGDHIVFDGSSNNSVAIAYKVVGSTWTPVSGSSFTDYKSSFDYEVLEDFTCAVDMKINGQPYAYTDYVYGSLRVSRAMSVRVLEKMKQDISAASGFSIPCPYAKVKNGKLIACDTIVQTSRADYLAVDMGGKVSYIGCKWYWGASHSARGVVCIASMPDTWSKKISGTNGITGKALHITCTMTNLRVDFLGGDWGETYYANLINQTLDLSSDPTVEHALSVTISGESVTVVVDGSTYTGTNSSDKSIDDVVGKYAFVEHYNASSNEEDMPEYTAFHVGSANGRMYDSFARENGLCTMSPQGYPYINVGTATASFPVW